MSIQPKTKVEELLEKFQTFSKDKVLSEFEQTRYLNQIKSIININPAEAWYVKGLVFYYANRVDDMEHALSVSLTLDASDKLVLCNTVACLMNHGQLVSAFEIFEKNANYFVSEKQDYDLVLKLSKLALKLFDFAIVEKMMAIIKPSIGDNIEISETSRLISQNYEDLLDTIENIGIEWTDANNVAKLAISILKENRIRPNSQVEVRMLDDEVYSTIFVHETVYNVLKINDLLFDKVYESNLIPVWNKLMFTFSSAPTKIDAEA